MRVFCGMLGSMKREFSLHEIQTIAEIILQSLQKNTQSATVLTLTGDLGAGKTTLTKAIGKTLGVTETMISPTFVIMKRYSMQNEHFDTLIHIDAYRLETPQEILSLGWNSIIENPRNLLIIEWPEKISAILPICMNAVVLEHMNEKKRKLVM